MIMDMLVVFAGVFGVGFVAYKLWPGIKAKFFDK